MSLIRELRQERGFTLAQLGERSGLHPSRLSRIENGKEGLTVEPFYRLVVALDLTDLAERLKPFVGTKGRIA